MTLAALSTEHKIGLAVVAAVFILFALVSALVIPRWKPEFPGRGRALFILVTIALFAGMMTAVFVFGKESGESEAGGSSGAGTTTAHPPPPPTPPKGNPAAGKQVFAANGCASCHTFQPAGATGTVGPDLSQVLKGKSVAFIHQSIVDPNAVIAPGYQPNIMPQTFGSTLSAKQLDDLVSFLQS